MPEPTEPDALTFLRRCLTASRGHTFCTHVLAVEWLRECKLDTGDAREFMRAVRAVSDACDTLCDAGKLVYVYCRHARHIRMDGPCSECGAAVVVGAIDSRNGRQHERQRIWSALCAARANGLTREQLAAKSNAAEKTVCWACRDWLAAGLIVELPERRATSSGRIARVLGVAGWKI